MAHYKMSDVAVEVNDRENNPANSQYERFVGLEHYVSGEVIIRNYGSTQNLESTMKIFQSGDVLVARRNVYLKRAATVDFDGLTSGDSIVLRAKNPVIGRILPFVLNTDAFWDFADQYSDGTMSKRLSPKTLMTYEFDLPNEDDLESFADLLWAANDTRESYQELLRQTDELVKSQFIELFGDPVTNSKKLPTMKLSKLGELNRGVSKSRPRNKPELMGGPYPLVQTGEVTAAELYITNYENTYSEAGLAQSKMWPKGTLCITIAANIAQTGILGFDACFPDSVVGFLANDKVKQIYVHYWFGFFQKILEEQAPQVAQKNINLKTLSDLDVMVPPIEQQNEFVLFVQQTDKSKFEIKKAIENTSALIKSLMQQDLST